MTTTTDRLAGVLYPPIEPHRTGHLDVGDGQLGSWGYAQGGQGAGGN